jgi:hypothetical protein
MMPSLHGEGIIAFPGEFGRGEFTLGRNLVLGAAGLPRRTGFYMST